MRKFIFTFLTALVLNVCLYSQNIFTLTHTFDFVSGPAGSMVLLPTGGWPGFSANSIPYPHSIIPAITSSDPNVYNINGSIGNLLALPNPSAGPATSFNFPIIKLSDGRKNTQIASEVFNPFGLVASSNSTSATIVIIDRPTGVIVSSADLLSESQLTELPPLWPQGIPNIKSVGINNSDGLPTLIKLNENTNQIVLTPLTDKPIGSDYTVLIRPTIIDYPPSKNLNNSIATLNDNTGYVFYKADDGIYGQELWITDGTITGTRMVKDINSSGDSFPFGFTPMNNKLYFFAATPNENNALWVSDGTELGTTMVKDMKPGGGYGYVDILININNTLFFVADDGTNGAELWKSDGTETGTVMIKDINPSGYSNPGGFTLFKELIYFRADDGIHGSGLWVTDGSAGGTYLVKNINNTGDGSTGSSIILPGLPNEDVFYFYADDGLHGKELWVSDGKRDGTKLAYDLYPGPLNSNDWSGWGLVSNGNLYVSGKDGAVGDELFVFENVPTTVPMKSLSLKVFLEGSYVSNSMSTNLGANIPLRQPFNNLAGNYYGDETIDAAFATTNNIVDWVKVELRSGISAATSTTIVASKAVLVNSDGNLVDLDGSLDIDFKWVDAGDYYVSVYHRNHLAVLSSEFVTLTN